MSDLGKRFRRYFKGLQEAPLEAEIPPDLIFDDEPLEWLLYGEGAHRANPANIFRPARSYLQRIIEARQGNRMEEIATLISSLISGGHPIPQGVYESLAEIFLNSPDLVLDDAAQTSADEMRAILERLWKNAEEQENDQLRLTAGIPLAYRLDIEQNVPAARSVWRTLASVQRRNVGLEDPYSSLVMTYALTYWKKGLWKTSTDRFKQSARILLNIKGDDNFSMQELTAANQLDLLVVAEASLRELAARYRSYEDDASLDRLFIYAVAVAITEKIAGPHHPFTASCVNVLARRLQDEGFHEAAEKLCKLALDARERGLGPEHPLVAQSLNNLGLSQVCLGRLDEAEPVLLRAAAIDKRFSNPHYWLGRLYKSRKSPDDRRKEATAWQRYLELGGWKEREEEARSRLKELSL